MERCRHSKSWIICDGGAEWCYECGAWRKLKLLEDNYLAADSKWVRPVGKGGENPAMRLKDE